MSRLLALLCLGFSYCSMQYFMLSTRLVGELTGDLPRWSAIGSACFLLAIGLGILKAERVKWEKLTGQVAEVEMLLAVLGPLSLVGIYLGHMLYRIYLCDYGLLVRLDEPSPVILFAALAQSIPLALGYCSGYEFGLINRLCIHQGLQRVQQVIALYHIGGLLANLGMMLYLIPRFEPLTIVTATAGLNLVLVGFWIWKWCDQGRRRKFLTFGYSSGFLALMVVGIQQTDMIQVHRKNFYYNQFHTYLNMNLAADAPLEHRGPLGLFEWWDRAKDYPTIERYRSFYQTIDFVQEAQEQQDPRFPPSQGHWNMFMDYHFQLSSRDVNSYHQVMAHVPSIIRGSASGRILLIGGGDGVLAHELLKADHVASGQGKVPLSIDLVDIDASILKLAREKPELRKLNGDALSDPRVRLFTADAFEQLRRNEQRYDAIYVDVLFPFTMENARLYSYEFFALLARALKPDGAMTILSPVLMEEFDDQSVRPLIGGLSSTLVKAGFLQIVHFAAAHDSFLLARLKQGDIAKDAGLYRSDLMSLIDDKELLSRIKEWPLFFDPHMVNSLLRPQFFGRPDPYF